MDNDTSLIRPKTLDSYVGQELIKLEIQIAIKSALTRGDALSHAIMTGPPGLGKTTLAEIIATEMDCGFHSLTGAGLDSEQKLQELFSRLPETGYDLKNGNIVDRSKIRPQIIFIDEIERMKKSISETLHTALEDFTISLTEKNHGGASKMCKFWLPRFTMIGATNYLGSMSKPFVDRFPIQLTFEIYKGEEIFEVVKFAAGKLGIEITDDAIVAISSRSRGVPRISNRFLIKARDVSIALSDFHGKIDKNCVYKMFSIQGIDELGLTRLDRKVLAYLNEIGRPVGLQSVAFGVDEDVSTIENLVEPWLVNLKLIIKTGSGRQITEKGIAHILGDEAPPRCGLRKLQE